MDNRTKERFFYFVEHIDSFWDDKNNVNWLGAQGIIVAKSGDQHPDEIARKHETYLKDEHYKPTEVEFYAKVDGKRITATSKCGKYNLTGAESAPGIFLFMVRYKEGGVYFCNNTYFVNPNLRQTIGPTLADTLHPGGICVHTKGAVQSFNAQTFNRVVVGPLHVPERHVDVPRPEEKAHSQRGLANVYAKAALDSEFRKNLKENPKEALEKYAKEHGLPTTIFAGVDAKEVKRILEEDCNDSPCPPICCS
ncbi:hypothetical protein [Sorangium sp. So ce693]|uniref:hypothetical protein n=1 Tax=Sorangium sp. So ce693 TaxID=3133318 RepID=UPI003F618C4B